MAQIRFSPVVYTVNDFREWDDDDKLILSPDFQRRGIWKPVAKSYLIDTIVRGKPIPFVFVRQTINNTTKKTVREVVDGQQRLRTILEFLDDGFKISKIHNKEMGGKKFSDLDPEIQQDILEYNIQVNVLKDPSNEEILDIFKRINSYSVPLNDQELLNAKYVGHFKQVVYELGDEFAHYFIRQNVITKQQHLRMKEDELISELVVAGEYGIHSRKQLESFYKRHDDSFEHAGRAMKRFRATMRSLDELYGDVLAQSNYRRIHLFYDLYACVYHNKYGLPNFDMDRVSIARKNYAPIQTAIDSVSSTLDKEEEEWSKDEAKFVTWSRRATTDLQTRRDRLAYLQRSILDCLS